MFNLYVEPMWQDERYGFVKVADKRMRIFTISKPQRESKREIEIVYNKP